MRMRLSSLLAGAIGAALVACGGPVLQNAPKPDPAVVAGAAAAIAGAATLADPQGAAKRQEANKPVEEKKPKTVKESVPEGVLDRLDDKKAGKPTDAPTKPAAAGEDPDGVPFDQAAPSPKKK